MAVAPKHDLVFTDRLLVTLVHLRTGLPHAVLAELYGIARSTISRAIGEIRSLPAMRGFAIPGHSGVRLRTLADVFRLRRGRGDRSGCGSTAPRPRFVARRQDLANEFPDHISAPPKKPKGDAPLGEQYVWREMCRRQSSQRICVEHANAGVRQW